VITGDVTQIDLARGQKSGLIEADRILAGVRGIAFTALHERRCGAPSAGAENRQCLRARRRQKPAAGSAITPSRGGLRLTVQYAVAAATLPAPGALRRWAKAAQQRDMSVTIRFVSSRESRRLNRDSAARTIRPTS
jgi:hypothetical protein